MAQTDPRTTQVTPVALLDEVVGNRDGSTVRQPVIDLAAQLVALGPLAAALAAKLTTEDLEPLQATTTDLSGRVAAVEGIATSGAVPHASVATVALTNIALTGVQTVAGVATDSAAALAKGVLVTGQAAPAENGVWVPGAGAWTRRADLDAAAEFGKASVRVDGGTYAGRTYWQTATITTLGTDAVVWSMIADDGPLFATKASQEALDRVAVVVWFVAPETAAYRKTLLEAAIATGRPVHINSPGSWAIDAGIALPSNTEIVIAKGVTLSPQGGASLFHSANITAAGISGRVSGIRIHGGGDIGKADLTAPILAGVWAAVALLNCDDGFVRGIRFTGATGCGVQHSGNNFICEDFGVASGTAVALNGPSENQTVRRMVNSGGGETVRVDAASTDGRTPVVGDIIRPRIEHIHGGSVSAVIVRTGAEADVIAPVINGVSGTFSLGGVISFSGAGLVDCPKVDGVDCSTSGTSSVIGINAAVHRPVLKNIRQTNPAATTAAISVGTAGVVTGGLLLDGLETAHTQTWLSIAGAVDHIRARRARVSFSANSGDQGAINVTSTGTVVRVVLDDFRQASGNALFSRSGGVGKTSIYLTDSVVASPRRLLFVAGGSVDLILRDAKVTGVILNVARATTCAVALVMDSTSQIITGTGAVYSVLVSGGTVSQVRPQDWLQLDDRNRPVATAVTGS